MFGGNYFGQGTSGQGSPVVVNIFIKLIRATTQYVSGFNRTTRRVL